jgi:predicted acylesterase/phospholipase RssA
MTQDEIIDMWHAANGVKIKGAEYDAVATFAQLVARHTLSNIDPSKFMSYQEGMEAGRLAEREEIAQFIEQTRLGSLPLEIALHYATLLGSYATAIRARGQA